ncbi:MAG: HAMP domain-containing histidine kinase [Lachnospiraceae bacterium]|nr:HAMP domain-containing histidine kinase [Lachnospiraceae bacterium]
MKGINKRKTVIVLSVSICFIGMFMMTAFFIKEYNRSVFKNMSAFCGLMIEEEPEAEQLVMSSLKKYKNLSGHTIENSSFLATYGYGSSEFGKRDLSGFVFISAAVFLMTVCGFLFALWYVNKYSIIRIAELTDYLEKVNIAGENVVLKGKSNVGCGDVELQGKINAGSCSMVLQDKEDEFSMLRDEMYKTITSLYQTNEAAIAAKAGYAENLANIAHQLKTPITAAFLSIQLMEKTVESIYVNRIKRQLGRLNRLEEALLTLSKIDAGVLKLDCEAVDIYTLLNLAAENLSEMMNENKVSVDIPYKDGVEFYGDMEWSMEAIINIMKNCMENTPVNGKLHCEYSSNPIYAEILIWDEGPGFEPSELPKLFERFYRGSMAAKEGIGIGLSLAKSIIELQNGTISAYNLPQGGACFEIKIYSH